MTTPHRRPKVDDITCPYRDCGKATGRSSSHAMGTQVFAEGAGEVVICEVCGGGIIVVLFDGKQRPRNPPIVKRRDPERPLRKPADRQVVPYGVGPYGIGAGGRRKP